MEPTSETSEIDDELWNVHPDVRNQIRDTGFSYMMEIKPRVSVPHGLIQAMVSLYDVESSCFNINGELIGITLEDVAYITGLPVDGEPVIGIESSAREYCKTYLGKVYPTEIRKEKVICLTEEGKGKTTGDVSYRWLKKHFEHVEAGTPVTPEHVRAYLLYVIGKAILPARASEGVPSMYLPLLENISAVKNFAWGAALLSELLCGLEAAKKRLENGNLNAMLDGSLFPVLVFAIERIPKLLLYILPRDLGVKLPDRLPLVIQWSSALYKVNRDTHRTKSRTDYLDFFRTLTEPHDIKWRPYSRLKVVPEHAILGQSKTMVFCFNYAARQNPIYCCKQFGIEVANEEWMGPTTKIYVKTRRGGKSKEGRDWRKVYEAYVNEWYSRYNNIIQGTPYNEDPTIHGSPSNEDTLRSLLPISFRNRRKRYLYVKNAKFERLKKLKGSAEEVRIVHFDFLQRATGRKMPYVNATKSIDSIAWLQIPSQRSATQYTSGLPDETESSSDEDDVGVPSKVNASNASVNVPISERQKRYLVMQEKKGRGETGARKRRVNFKTVNLQRTFFDEDDLSPINEIVEMRLKDGGRILCSNLEQDAPLIEDCGRRSTRGQGEVGQSSRRKRDTHDQGGGRQGAQSGRKRGSQGGDKQGAQGGGKQGASNLEQDAPLREDCGRRGTRGQGGVGQSSQGKRDVHGQGGGKRHARGRL